MKFIKVRTQFEGFHCWKEAPALVSFLRNKHRHLFKVEAMIEVFENDRELEYFMVKQFLDELITEYIVSMEETESCEMMAECFLDYLEAKYRSRRIQVEVSEDGENSSLVNNFESFKN